MKKMGYIVDFSKWQNRVNYEELSKVCDLAILRVQDGSYVKDVLYEQHAKGCSQFAIPYGVYAFARFTSVKDAEKEAQDFYERANRVKQPLFYVADVEVESMSDMRAGTNAFIRTLRNLGAKKVGIYIAHHLYYTFCLDLTKADFIWIPRYHLDGKTILKPKFPCDLHQYTERGRIKGIEGYVDLNRLNGKKKLAWFIAE